MKLAVTYPDPEPLVVSYLKAQFAALGDVVTVSKDVPANFDPLKATQVPHVQVALDGTPGGTHPVYVDCTIRLVGWAPAGYQSKAIRLTNRAQGLLLASTGPTFSQTEFLTGALADRDNETNAEIAATTTRVTVRSQPIEPV